MSKVLNLGIHGLSGFSAFEGSRFKAKKTSWHAQEVHAAQADKRKGVPEVDAHTVKSNSL